ncbi:hypothetical protein RUE5091_00522 [Ruegeria denitrificans]|uniref:Uncharacterized protein n=1 Tax=Ruegeria denitrificans TaxID=1715692 RepID=A0A0P1I331_9RHOB|nr:hypothetical protein [Ruegeria denitrificans]CUJ86856.1 hypothetical protein RUE5091_00522 [Ruegeria denitrificans]
MPPTNVIINETFDNGDANWTGTDLEFKSECAFLGKGPSNTVTELDGNRNAVTVLEQSFTLTDPKSGQLTFDTAL